MHPLVKLAKATIEQYIAKGTRPQAAGVPEEFLTDRAGVFVSLKIKGQLRGCIGTFMPQEDSIAQEIVRNAISASTEDPRFPPVSQSELEQLEYSVDVLSPPEPVSDISELDPKRYGVIVKSGFRRGLLLPDLEGVDTVEYQISIAMNKAGISPEEQVSIERFEVKRYK